jgi:hypothetical protein
MGRLELPQRRAQRIQAWRVWESVVLERPVEPSAEKREAPWKNFHAAGAGFRTHGLRAPPGPPMSLRKERAGL